MRHLLLSLTLVLSLGCGRGQEADDAEDADESVAVTSTESALTAEFSDEVAQPMSATPEQLAAAAGTRIAGRVQPAGCLVVTQNGATVTYVFTNCTGPYGLVTMNGTVTVVYSRPSAGVVRAVITSTGFQANAATLNLNATVDATQTNTVKRAEVTSTTTGTGPRGNALNRNGDYVVTWDTATECVTLDGTWETGVGTRTASTVVAGFRKCKGSCPASGTVTHTAVRGNTVTITYDGDATAAWSTSGGRSGTVTLRCGS